MERLTSNKSVSEMGIYELAHNSCYTKQNEARVRDFENDFDARELTIKLFNILIKNAQFILFLKYILCRVWTEEEWRAWN